MTGSHDHDLQQQQQKLSVSYFEYDHYPLLECHDKINHIFDFNQACKETGWQHLTEYLDRFKLDFVKASSFKSFELDYLSPLSNRSGFGLSTDPKGYQQDEHNFYDSKEPAVVERRQLLTKQYAQDAVFTRMFTCDPTHRSAVIRLCAELSNGVWSVAQLTALTDCVQIVKLDQSWSVVWANGMSGCYVSTAHALQLGDSHYYYSSPEDHLTSNVDSQTEIQPSIVKFMPQAIPNFPFLLIPTIHWARRSHYLHLAVEATIRGVTPDMSVTDINNRLAANLAKMM